MKKKLILLCTTTLFMLGSMLPVTVKADQINSSKFVPVKSIIAGDSNISGAIREDGEVVLWGNSEMCDYAPMLKGSKSLELGVCDSQIGAIKYDGTMTVVGAEHNTRKVPQELKDAKVKKICLDYLYSYVIKEDGTYKGWGSTHSPTPWGEKDIEDVIINPSFSVVLHTDGTISNLSRYSTIVIPKDFKGVKEIKGTSNGIIALKSDGTMYNFGTTSILSGREDLNTVKLLRSENNIKAIEAGASHYVALKNDGTVVCWGVNSESDNSHGQLNVPASLKNVKQVVAKNDVTLALKEDGTVVGWGDNSTGICNIPSTLKNVKQISIGNGTALALKKDGTVVAWGNNEYGKCNIPKNINSSSVNLSPITVDGNEKDWKGIAPIASAKGDVNSLYCYKDALSLNFLVKGNNLDKDATSFYIDSDNDEATGYHSSLWKKSGIDYLIEGDCVYKYNGSGEDWNWEKIGTASIVKKKNIIEVKVPRLEMASTTLSKNMKVSYAKGFNKQFLPQKGNKMIQCNF